MSESLQVFDGALLAQRRRVLGFTQEQLAREVSVSEPYISQLENGARQPSVTTLVRLASALDVEMGFFFGGAA